MPFPFVARRSICDFIYLESPTWLQLGTNSTLKYLLCLASFASNMTSNKPKNLILGTSFNICSPLNFKWYKQIYYLFLFTRSTTFYELHVKICIYHFRRSRTCSNRNGCAQGSLNDNLHQVSRSQAQKNHRRSIVTSKTLQNLFIALSGNDLPPRWDRATTWIIIVLLSARPLQTNVVWM